MLQIKTPRGNVYYSEELIKNIVALSALKCNGVIGLANRNFREADDKRSNTNIVGGVKVDFTNEKLNVHIFVVVKYGIKISIIANDIIQKVKDSIEKFLDVSLNSIVVNIKGIRP